MSFSQFWSISVGADRVVAKVPDSQPGLGSRNIQWPTYGMYPSGVDKLEAFTRHCVAIVAHCRRKFLQYDWLYVM